MTFSKVYISENVAEFPETLKVSSRINAEKKIIENSSELFNIISSDPDPIRKGKQILFLTDNRGAFLKQCPGTKNYICCGYKILHTGTYCTMDCSYCILQSYFHPPVVQYFVNRNDMKKELDTVFSAGKILRIGTGEFTDSMILEKETNLSSYLVEKFANQSSCVLELKTKSVNIKNLKNIDHNRKTIIAWSLNTLKVISEEERNTASLRARIYAAKECGAMGYPLAFHFDPMIIYDGCEKDYKEVIDLLFANVSADNIIWISLGTFRFIPTLKAIIEHRFCNSKIIYGEFITGLDNKMRYFKPIRIKFYKKIVSMIKERAPDTTVYFCMEDEEVWKKSLGFQPSDKDGLPAMLDKSAKKHCAVKEKRQQLLKS